jgi:hypothetical protein
MGDNKRRGHDLESGHPRHRRALQPFAYQIAQTLFFQGTPNAADYLYDIAAGAAAWVEHPDIRVGKALVAAERGAQHAVDPFDHVDDDLRRGVPDAERAAQLRIEVFQKRLVKVLHRLRIVERCKEGRSIDAAEGLGGCIEQWHQFQRLQRLGGRGLLE